MSKEATPERRATWDRFSHGDAMNPLWPPDNREEELVAYVADKLIIHIGELSGDQSSQVREQIIQDGYALYVDEDQPFPELQNRNALLKVVAQQIIDTAIVRSISKDEQDAEKRIRRSRAEGTISGRNQSFSAIARLYPDDQLAQDRWELISNESNSRHIMSEIVDMLLTSSHEPEVPPLRG